MIGPDFGVFITDSDYLVKKTFYSINYSKIHSIYRCTVLFVIPYKTVEKKSSTASSFRVAHKKFLLAWSLLRRWSLLEHFNVKIHANCKDNQEPSLDVSDILREQFS